MNSRHLLTRLIMYLRLPGLNKEVIKLKKILETLLKIKSIITLVIMFVFVYCVINGIISPENIMVIISMVITFYFAKNNGGGGTNE